MPYSVSSAKYAIREVGSDHFVIDVSWPSGATEQLVGVFTSHAHARRWLSTVPDTVAEANDRHVRLRKLDVIPVVTSAESDTD